MTLSVSNVGDNPQQPSIQAEAYIPDQLIAGNLKLVTDTVTIKSGADLVRGTVLGQITMASATGAPKAGGNTGNGTFTIDATTPVLANARPGIYTARCIAAAANSGTFEIKDPLGDSLGEYTVGATFADQIKFVIADGSADFVVGDGFDITVAAGSGKYVEAVATAVDGSATPVAILADAAAASGADVVAPVYLMGEFNANALTYDGSFTLAAVKAALRKVGIFVKSSVSAADPS